MPTYSYSLHGGARYAHLGAPVPVCYAPLPVRYATSTNLPIGLTLCPKCARLTGIKPEEATVADDDRRARVLRLLNTGDSDQQIANRLGFAIATIRRDIVVIMRHLGARTRWHAGYLASMSATAQPNG